MTLLQTVVLSIVQGVTELLPVSSSGHLLLVSQYLFEIEITQSVLVGLHFGTTLAILLFLSKDMLNLLKENGIRFFLHLIIASTPAAIVGIAFGDMIEANLYTTSVVAMSLIFWGIIFIAVEKQLNGTKKRLDEVTALQSFIMGLGQTIALIPGTSRSGITTITGILSGLDKYTALQYSFIMGLPVLIGSALLTIIKVDSPSALFSTELLIGSGISFIVGLAAMQLLKNISEKKFLTGFGIYRIVLGVVLLIL